MKKIVLFIIILAIFNFSSAQEYYIIHVKGSIKNLTNNSILKSGDKISLNDEIVFENKDAMAALIHKDMGNIAIMPYKTDYGTELRMNVEQSLLVSSERLSSRTAMPEASSYSHKPFMNQDELKNHFGCQDYLILNNRVEVEVDFENFPIKKSFFFYIQFDYGGIMVYKTLEFTESSIILDFNKIFKFNEEIISETKIFDFEIYYNKGKKKMPEKICNFDPTFVNNDEILPRIKIIAEIIGDDEDKFINKVYEYLLDYYGIVHIPNLKSWLDENFKE